MRKETEREKSGKKKLKRGERERREIFQGTAETERLRY